MNEHDDVEYVAVFVHGALAFGHLIGVLFNLRRKNYKASLFHFGACLGDLYAVYLHWKDLHEKRGT